jgi:hypothetical protein
MPSDFVFFGDISRKLRGSRFQTDEQLVIEIRKLVGEISPETLLDFFRDWMAWCESVIASNGNYFE